MDSMKLVMSANADVLSFSLSFYYGIVQQSGAFWLAPHSIEKYLKAILIFHNPKTDLKKLGHNLSKLTSEVCKVQSMPDFIPSLVCDLNGVDIDFRYCDSGGYDFPKDLFYKVWVAGRWLRIAVNRLNGIDNDKLFGVGAAYASPVLRTEAHNHLRKLIEEFETNCQSGKDYHTFSGWIDISVETRALFYYPT